jgi:hypothetical protein
LFLYYSRLKKIANIAKLPDLSLTLSGLLTVAKHLPFGRYLFDIYMNNYFTNVPLFSELRNVRIGSFGATWPCAKGFLKEFRKLRLTKAPPTWNTLSAKEVTGVLALLWMDNNSVMMFTTIHEVVGAHNHVYRLRSRPRKSSTNASIVRPLFGDHPTHKLSIPTVVYDINHHMGGVDIADQRRSY